MVGAEGSEPGLTMAIKALWIGELVRSHIDLEGTAAQDGKSRCQEYQVEGGLP